MVKKRKYNQLTTDLIKENYAWRACPCTTEMGPHCRFTLTNIFVKNSWPLRRYKKRNLVYQKQTSTSLHKYKMASDGCTLIYIKFAPASLARARAINVFPHPGGP